MNSEEMSAKYKELVTETRKKLAKLCENIGADRKNMIEEKLMQEVEKDYQNRAKQNEEKTISESKKIFHLFENSQKLPSYGTVKDSYEELSAQFIIPFKQNCETFLARYLKDFKGTQQKYKVAVEMMSQTITKYYEKIIEVFKKISENELEEAKLQLQRAREGEQSLRNTLQEYEGYINTQKEVFT